eukprot:CAMPEP_0119155876 /NCGR_PEP_ID=MMETSP1310-20130426/51973_1 /TAXON_ID=464262 /ORGANISM="Genus nov. species nov., Strain RCC2339" /LENGTH=858 /DNA_ID=CAMNT_0007148483 /DNA_START=92 /DNA_END=2665 /DNA_ORIENTATION=-
MGKDTIHTAAYAGDLKTVKGLMKKTAVNSLDAEGRTAAHYAVAGGHVHVLNHLVVKGRANLNLQDKDGTTPLLIAASKSHVECLRFLIANGGNVDAMDKSGNTILHHLIRSNKLNAQLKEELIKSVLAKKMTMLNAQNCNGDTAVHEVCRMKDERLLGLITKKGASVSVQNGSGDTPMHLVAAEDGGLPLMIKLVAVKGCDLHLLNRRKMTPHDVARSVGNEQVYQWLMTTAPPQAAPSPFESAASGNDLFANLPASQSPAASKRMSQGYPAPTRSAEGTGIGAMPSFLMELEEPGPSFGAASGPSWQSEPQHLGGGGAGMQSAYPGQGFGGGQAGRPTSMYVGPSGGGRGMGSQRMSMYAGARPSPHQMGHVSMQPNAQMQRTPSAMPPAAERSSQGPPSSEPLKGASAPAMMESKESSEKLFVAIYPYKGDSAGKTLAFAKGDVITFIKVVNEKWHYGRLGDKAGMYPVPYVKPLPSAADKADEKRREEEDRLRQEEVDRLRQEEEQRLRQEEAERLRREEEEKRLRREEEERLRREEEERLRREEEERLRREEEERLRREEEERLRREEEERLRREEEERLRREEEDRLRREEEEKRRLEEEHERLRMEEELRQEEERLRVEEERLRQEEERIRKEEAARLLLEKSGFYPGMMVVAVYNFQGDGKKTFTLEKGDTLTFLKHVNDKWSMGKREGKMGLFPTPYVKPFEDDDTDAMLGLDSLLKEVSDSTANLMSAERTDTGGVSPQPSKAREEPAESPERGAEETPEEVTTSENAGATPPTPTAAEESDPNGGDEAPGSKDGGKDEAADSDPNPIDMDDLPEWARESVAATAEEYCFQDSENEKEMGNRSETGMPG